MSELSEISKLNSLKLYQEYLMPFVSVKNDVILRQCMISITCYMKYVNMAIEHEVELVIDNTMIERSLESVSETIAEYMPVLSYKQFTRDNGLSLIL